MTLVYTLVPLLVTLLVAGLIVWKVKSAVRGVTSTIPGLDGIAQSVRGGSDKQELAHFLQTQGHKARARIVDVASTGVIMNQLNIQCRVTFQIEPLDGAPAFAGEKVITINQTRMPRVGDLWPCWFNPGNPAEFAVGAPGTGGPEQVEVFRQFGIPHPLDPSGAAAAPTPTAPTPAPYAPAPDPSDRVEALERLAQLHRDGLLTAEEFAAEKSRLLAQ